MTTIVQAMAAVMADVQAVGKKDRNQAQGFDFRGIDAVMNAVGPALRTHGVVVVPEVVTADYGTVEIGRNRSVMGHARVVVKYHFHGPAGDSITSCVAAEAMDSGDKATAKAMSVAFRTCLLQALCLPTHEPDPDASSYERSEREDAGPDDHRAEGWTQAMASADALSDLAGIASEIRSAHVSTGVRRSLLARYAEAEDRLGGGS